MIDPEHYNQVTNPPKDYPLAPYEVDAKNASLGSVHAKLFALSALVARVIDHLDPHGTSQTLRVEKTEGDDAQF